VLGVTAINLGSSSRGLMWILMALLPSMGLIGGAYAVPVIFGRILVDRQAISVNVDGVHLKLDWHDVHAARITVQDREPYLILGVGAGLYVVPLRHYKIRPLWDAIVWAAPAGAVLPDALEPYERKDGNEGISPTLWLVGVLRVADHRGLSIAAGVGAAVFLALFLIGLLNRQPGSVVYLVFSALYLLLTTGIGSTEFDPQGVTRRTLLGTTRILWDELSAVETGPFSLRIVLEGMRGRRRMVLFGPPLWMGADAARAVHFFALQISTRRLPRRRSPAALFKISRNIRLTGD
jgi:hypothetical protein